MCVFLRLQFALYVFSLQLGVNNAARLVNRMEDLFVGAVQAEFRMFRCVEGKIVNVWHLNVDGGNLRCVVLFWVRFEIGRILATTILTAVANANIDIPLR